VVVVQTWRAAVADDEEFVVAARVTEDRSTDGHRASASSRACAVEVEMDVDVTVTRVRCVTAQRHLVQPQSELTRLVR